MGHSKEIPFYRNDLKIPVLLFVRGSRVNPPRTVKDECVRVHMSYVYT